MSTRIGRPKIENPLNHNIKVRVDDKTNQSLLQYAQKHNLHRTEVIRQAIQQLLLKEEAFLDGVQDNKEE